MFTDIDECTENGRICLNGDCMNTPGTYRCICQRGYELSPDGAFCLGMIYIYTPIKLVKLLLCQRFPFLFYFQVIYFYKQIQRIDLRPFPLETLTVRDIDTHRISADD